MYKFLFSLFCVLFFSNVALAENVIYTIENGTKLKCTGEKTRGIIEEYDGIITDYYTFKNNKIYSRNMIDTFKDGQGKERKVKKLQISNTYITFKERLYTAGASNYKWVRINRQTGDYRFRAKKQYNWAWYNRKARVVGKCEIEK